MMSALQRRTSSTAAPMSTTDWSPHLTPTPSRGTAWRKASRSRQALLRPRVERNGAPNDFLDDLAFFGRQPQNVRVERLHHDSPMGFSAHRAQSVERPAHVGRNAKADLCVFADPGAADACR